MVLVLGPDSRTMTSASCAKRFAWHNSMSVTSGEVVVILFEPLLLLGSDSGTAAVLILGLYSRTMMSVTSGEAFWSNQCTAP